MRVEAVDLGQVGRRGRRDAVLAEEQRRARRAADEERGQNRHVERVEAGEREAAVLGAALQRAAGSTCPTMGMVPAMLVATRVAQ